MNSAFAHLQIDVLDRHEAFEFLGDATGLQHDMAALLALGGRAGIHTRKLPNPASTVSTAPTVERAPGRAR